ncbi:hypothetical protein SAMN04515674_106143 [Pseudarcicella hirudinis]|uniref:Uncharacterized protein n=1 Tax=Pseudarcicella hirudinis TaxID=1079859 RepID=A0A1I5TQ28_9BACT|nr:hypothetical protein SAMN04515674_106143 [Pseudarcicella hirudinis]
MNTQLETTVISDEELALAELTQEEEDTLLGFVYFI